MRPIGTIHAAHLDGSPRLQRVLAFLRERGSAGATTRDIIEATGVCAVNSAIDELRANGIYIPPATREGCHRICGSTIYRYRIEQEVKP